MNNVPFDMQCFFGNIAELSQMHYISLIIIESVDCY